jgi:hypothetical protein
MTWSSESPFFSAVNLFSNASSNRSAINRYWWPTFSLQKKSPFEDKKVRLVSSRATWFSKFSTLFSHAMTSVLGTTCWFSGSAPLPETTMAQNLTRVLRISIKRLQIIFPPNLSAKFMKLENMNFSRKLADSWSLYRSSTATSWGDGSSFHYRKFADLHSTLISSYYSWNGPSKKIEFDHTSASCNNYAVKGKVAITSGGQSRFQCSDLAFKRILQELTMNCCRRRFKLEFFFCAQEMTLARGSRQRSLKGKLTYPWQWNRPSATVYCWRQKFVFLNSRP